MSYQWPAVSPQPGVVERRLQVRRHAVDEVAVGALQHLLSGFLSKTMKTNLGVHARAWMVRSAGLLSRLSSACTLLYRRSCSPGRNAAVSFADAAPARTQPRKKKKSRRRRATRTVVLEGAAIYQSVPWGPEWMVHWLPLLAAALGGSRRIRIHWPRRGRAAIAWECGASAPTNLGFARAARSEVNSLYQQQ
jgi:hypothetical protein